MALQLHNLRLSHIDINIAISFLTVIAVSGLMLQLKAKELSDDPSFKVHMTRNFFFLFLVV